MDMQLLGIFMMLHKGCENVITGNNMHDTCRRQIRIK